MRFVGFASNHQKMLKEFIEGRKSVEICNCQVKKSNRDSDKPEALVKGATMMFPSAQKLQQIEAVEITLG